MYLEKGSHINTSVWHIKPTIDSRHFFAFLISSYGCIVQFMFIIWNNAYTNLDSSVLPVKHALSCFLGGYSTVNFCFVSFFLNIINVNGAVFPMCTSSHTAFVNVWMTRNGVFSLTGTLPLHAEKTICLPNRKSSATKIELEMILFTARRGSGTSKEYDAPGSACPVTSESYRSTIVVQF